MGHLVSWRVSRQSWRPSDKGAKHGQRLVASSTRRLNLAPPPARNQAIYVLNRSLMFSNAVAALHVPQYASLSLCLSRGAGEEHAKESPPTEAAARMMLNLSQVRHLKRSLRGYTPYLLETSEHAHIF